MSFPFSGVSSAPTAAIITTTYATLNAKFDASTKAQLRTGKTPA
ncbi:hypothetical protein [Acidocella sp.]|nr:hypothetical protein [Acidocella sp.]